MKQTDRRTFLRYAGLSTLAATTGTLSMAGKALAAGDKIHPKPPAAAQGAKNVRTVRGLIAPEHLGVTDMHEHVLRDHILTSQETEKLFDVETIKKMAMLGDPKPVPESFFPGKDNTITLENRHAMMHFYPNAKDAFLLDEELMMGEVGDFASLGGNSILDCSVTFERGNPEVMKRMSEKSGVNLVMSTGINSHVLIPAAFKEMDVKGLTEYFEQELYVGINGTDICAGNIKLLAEREDHGERASSDETLLRGVEAAAAVSRNSGVPVTVHAYDLGDEVLKEFLGKAKDLGMPKDRMILSHFSTALRPMAQKELVTDPDKFKPNLDIGFWAMDQGYILSFDLFGAGHGWIDSRGGDVPSYDPLSFAAIYQFVKAGYGDRIVMGTDLWARTSARRNGGPGIAHLLNFVVPQLKESGVPQDAIDQIMVKTPARLLAF